MLVELFVTEQNVVVLFLFTLSSEMHSTSFVPSFVRLLVGFALNVCSWIGQ